MRLALLAPLILLVLPSLSAAAPPPPPPALEPLLLDAARRGPTTLRLAHPAAALADGRLRVLVRLQPGTSVEALAGFERERAAGSVVPVRVEPGRLEALARVPGVVLVEACRTLWPRLDRSAPGSGASKVWQSAGLDGEGVVVGVLDTGLDFRHLDFQDQRGRTRLLHLLDFSREDKGAKQSFERRAYSAAEIDTQLSMDRSLGTQAPNLVPHRDLIGHGTHVAGIAAGNGRGAAPRFPARTYVGMAPGASIIAVQGSRVVGGGFHDADILHGLQYIFERAEARGMPAVINLSFGTQLGPHDGSSNLATGISALVGPDRPGRVLVAAAGNDGDMDLHAVTFPRHEKVPGQVVLEVPAYQPSASRELVHLELWYGDGDLTLELTSPAGRSLQPIPGGKSLEQLTDEGLVKILNAPSGPYKPNGRYLAVVVVEERGEVSPAPGRWTLELRGQADRCDTWLVNPGIRGAAGDYPRLLGPLSADLKINSPGTARGVISVGAYSTREAWDSMAGPVVARSVTRGGHASWSSTGPTLDRRFAPDVAAPGEYIVAALSMHAPPDSPLSSFYSRSLPLALWHRDQVRGLLRGTSMAAPHVTGAVALLLQRQPRLTLPQARELLRVGARIDEPGEQGRAWSPRWGFGKLDVARSLAVLDGEAAGALSPRDSGVAVDHDLLPAGSLGRVLVTVIPRDQRGLPLGPGQRVELSTSAGQISSPAGHVAYGRYEALLTPSGHMGQTARITARVNGVELSQHPLVHLTTRRELVGAHLRATGGACSVSSGPPPPLPLAPLALLLGWLLGARLATRLATWLATRQAAAPLAVHVEGHRVADQAPAGCPAPAQAPGPSGSPSRTQTTSSGTHISNSARVYGSMVEMTVPMPASLR